MSEESTGSIQNSSDGGVAGTHPNALAHAVLVGTSTANERNLITTGIIPVACWRVDDVRFEFDSSFVRPQLAKEVKHLAELREQHKMEIKPAIGSQPAVAVFPPMSIFGHADPTGNDDYNKQLSGRRSIAIYGMLIRDTKLWEELYSQPLGKDKWGVKAIQTMLTALGFSPGGGEKMNEETRKAVKEFQKENGLSADGEPGPQTRTKLFLAYMDKICTKEFKLDRKEDFLARGADTGGKGDYQGCSEFNPILVFSQKEAEEFKKPEQKEKRDTENAPNRRVMVLLFRPGSRVTATKWPCPRAKEGVAWCKKRFWSDAEKRRNSRRPDKPRKFQETADTFACRFYHRLSGASPCERILKSFQVRLYDSFRRSIPFAPFAVSIGNADFTPTDRADAQGIIGVRDVEAPATCTIKWGFRPERGDSPELLFSRTIFLVAENDKSPEAATKKLSNLGYDSDDRTENITGFQLDYGDLTDPDLSPTGELDDRTMELLERVYKQAKDDLRDTSVK